jgi:hypothetical protein
MWPARMRATRKRAIRIAIAMSRAIEIIATFNRLANSNGTAPLAVVEVDLDTLADEVISADLPGYLTGLVDRHKHTSLYGQIKALAEHWEAQCLVWSRRIGAGLAFLDKALPRRVVPFIFSQKSKSDLGWGFLAVVETGGIKSRG